MAVAEDIIKDEVAVEATSKVEVAVAVEVTTYEVAAAEATSQVEVAVVDAEAVVASTDEEVAVAGTTTTMMVGKLLNKPLLVNINTVESLAIAEGASESIEGEHDDDGSSKLASGLELLELPPEALWERALVEGVSVLAEVVGDPRIVDELAYGHPGGRIEVEQPIDDVLGLDGHGGPLGLWEAVLGRRDLVYHAREALIVEGRVPTQQDVQDHA